MSESKKALIMLLVIALCLLIVGILSIVGLALGPQLLNMKSEYVTAGVIRDTHTFVKHTGGQWPRSWQDVGGDASKYTRMRFDLDPATATKKDVMSAIAPRSGKYYTYPHAEEHLKALWLELKEQRERMPGQRPEAKVTKLAAVVGEDAAEAVRFAAEELARYVTQASGLRCAVGEDKAMTGRHALALMPPGADLRRIEVSMPGVENEEAYRVYSLRIGRGFTGNTPRAVLFAVYDFLEQSVGYRWYFPYPEDNAAPRITREAFLSILSQREDRVEQPAFAFREREFRDVTPMTDQTDERIVQQIDWWAKLRMNRFLLNFQYAGNAELWARWSKRLIPEIKKRGMLVGLGEHGSYPLFLPPARYAKEHPEWYCEIDGRRIADMRTPSGQAAQFCTTNEEAVVAYLENFAAFVRKHPEIDFYYPAPNDVGRWCECAECRKLSVADRYLRLNNRVAEMLETVKPGTRVMHLAYSNHRLPPEDTLPHPMIDVDVACWGRDFAYPLSDPRTMPGDPQYLNVFRQWSAICARTQGASRPRLLYHCKLMRHYWLGLHLAPLRIIDEDFACARDVGLDGFDFPLGFVGIRTKALNAYVVANKCWNPETRAETITGQFMKDYYGAGADDARKIYRLVDEAFQDLRYGRSLGLAWFPSTTAVRDAPLPGLGDNARRAVEKLDEALATADSAVSRGGAEAERFRKLRAMLLRARDEQLALVRFDALAQARHELLQTSNRETRGRARQAWEQAREATESLEAGYVLQDDLAGLYWAGASHKSLHNALEAWSAAVEGLDWRVIGQWTTEDFNDDTAPVTKHFDVTDAVAELAGGAPMRVRFKYGSGQLGASIRAVSLFAIGENDESVTVSEDRHGGFAGYVHENSVYRLKLPPQAAKGARYRLSVTLAAYSTSGRVSERGCFGDVLIGFPEKEED